MVEGHADGYRWLMSLTRDNPRYWLANTRHRVVAHVVRVKDGTWTVTDANEKVVVEGLASVGDGMSAADTAFRPCAVRDPRCRRRRAPELIFCREHAEEMAA